MQLTTANVSCYCFTTCSSRRIHPLHNRPQTQVDQPQPSTGADSREGYRKPVYLWEGNVFRILCTAHAGRTRRFLAPSRPHIQRVNWRYATKRYFLQRRDIECLFFVDVKFTMSGNSERSPFSMLSSLVTWRWVLGSAITSCTSPNPRFKWDRQFHDWCPLPPPTFVLWAHDPWQKFLYHFYVFFVTCSSRLSKSTGILNAVPLFLKMFKPTWIWRPDLHTVPSMAQWVSCAEFSSLWHELTSPFVCWSYFTFDCMRFTFRWWHLTNRKPAGWSKNILAAHMRNEPFTCCHHSRRNGIIHRTLLSACIAYWKKLLPAFTDKRGNCR